MARSPSTRSTRSTSPRSPRRRSKAASCRTRRRGAQELLRARPRVLDVRPRARRRDQAHPPAVREEPAVRRSQRQGAQGRLPLRRDRPGVPDPLQRAPAQFAPGMYRNITGNEALALGLVVGAELAGKSCSTAAIRSRRRRRSCTRSRSTRNFGTLHVPGRGRDRRDRRGALGAAYGGAVAVAVIERPGHRAQGRGDRARR